MHTKSIFLLAILCWCTLSYALPNDRQQPIKIESDRAEQNEKKGTTTYEGSVVIRQGSIKINADKVTVFSETDKVDRIVCEGKPAHYQQRPNPEDGLVLASAKTIKYYLVNDKIALLKNASLEQNGTVITGEKIDYDLKAEVVKATSGRNTKERIKMVIPPSNQKDSD
jgi:lipopolysaccharide export system protein LptA